jgi:protein ImuA
MAPGSFCKLDLRIAAARPSEPVPGWAAQLEEVTAAEPADWAAALGFGLDRLCAKPDPRPLALVTTRNWMRERGRPYAAGLRRLGVTPGRILLVCVDRESEALWAFEEALKSQAVAGGLAMIETAAFVATRRLDFAAKAGNACGVMLRTRPAGDLSAAKVRWSISSLPSAEDGLDARAPGSMRWSAQVTRRRDGPPADFIWEEGDAPHRLRLAARLAGDGLVQADRTHAAA